MKRFREWALMFSALWLAGCQSGGRTRPPAPGRGEAPSEATTQIDRAALAVSIEDARREFRRVPDLLLMFGSASPSQWESARRELKEKEATLQPAIVDALKRSASPEARTAAQAREWLARQGRIITLLYGFNERSEAAWDKARRSLTAMGEDATDAAVDMLLMKFRLNDHEKYDWARRQLIAIGHRSVAPAALVMVHPDTDRLAKEECARTLVELGSEGSKLLGQAIQEKDWRTRYAIAAALGKTEAVEFSAPLLERFLREDDDWRIRGEAAAALSNLKSSRAAGALLSGLQDSDPLVQRNCVEGLGRLKERRAVPELIRLLDRSRDEPRVVQMACWSLHEITGQALSADPQKAVYDPDGWKRWWATTGGR